MPAAQGAGEDGRTGRSSGRVGHKGVHMLKGTRAPVDSAKHELALCFRTLGWMLVGIDWLIVVFVPVGLKDGSTLWAWWFAIEALAGLSLVAIGYVIGEPETLPHAAHEPQQHRVRVAPASSIPATAE